MSEERDQQGDGEGDDRNPKRQGPGGEDRAVEEPPQERPSNEPPPEANPGGSGVPSPQR